MVVVDELAVLRTAALQPFQRSGRLGDGKVAALAALLTLVVVEESRDETALTGWT